MKLGMIGLGRMGANMAQRLMRGGHQLAGLIRNPKHARTWRTRAPNPRIRLPRW